MEQSLEIYSLCSFFEKNATLKAQQKDLQTGHWPEREVSMTYIESKQRCKCHVIIHTASVSAGAVGAGLAQLPCSDNAVITPIQLAMTVALGRVFGIELTDSAARASLASIAASTVGRTASQVLLGWIPVAGNVINACTAASITETIGWLMAEDFAKQAIYD